MTGLKDNKNKHGVKGTNENLFMGTNMTQYLIRIIIPPIYTINKIKPMILLFKQTTHTKTAKANINWTAMRYGLLTVRALHITAKYRDIKLDIDLIPSSPHSN